MGRNAGLVFSLATRISASNTDTSGLYPIHLATTYLDGSYPCCNVLCCVVYRPSIFSLRKLYVDNHSYTVLDNLMVAALRCHASCKPRDIDERHVKNRLMGEEVEICGRWDADSECTQELLTRGKSTSLPYLSAGHLPLYSSVFRSAVEAGHQYTKWPVCFSMSQF